MNTIVKNIVAVLITITAVLGLYYFLSQDAALSLEVNSEDRQLQELFSAAQTFTERQRVLDSIELNLSVFDNDGFQSLESFSTKPLEYVTGRENPFLPIDTTSQTVELPVSSAAE